MMVSINSALSSLGARFQDVDFDGIQCIVDTLSDPKVSAAAQADPQNFMISEMQKNNIPVPDGLHFHWRNGNILVPPEAKDCVPPPTSLVLAAAPSKPYELERFQINDSNVLGDEDLAPAPPQGTCRSCFICLVF